MSTKLPEPFYVSVGPLPVDPDHLHTRAIAIIEGLIDEVVQKLNDPHAQHQLWDLNELRDVLNAWLMKE